LFILILKKGKKCLAKAISIWTFSYIFALISMGRVKNKKELHTADRFPEKLKMKTPC
jgi:hypothetical protein